MYGSILGLHVHVHVHAAALNEIAGGEEVRGPGQGPSYHRTDCLILSPFHLMPFTFWSLPLHGSVAWHVHVLHLSPPVDHLLWIASIMKSTWKVHNPRAVECFILWWRHCLCSELNESTSSLWDAVAINMYCLYMAQITRYTGKATQCSRPCRKSSWHVS